MTTFVRGRTVETTAAVVEVDAGLAVGTHRFQLVVVRDDGRRSAPQVVDVVVRRQVVVIEPQPQPQPPLTRPPLTGVTPIVTPVVRPGITPVVRPTRAPAEARKTRARKPAKSAKPRSET
ncbi:MAG TPA: hypothetical protein PK201_04495 [Accumulibacter sp.]|nr:hypothetical protein [Accumulibacter sp.]